MSSGRYDFTIEQGATFTREITWQDSLGSPIDLTTYTITGKLKRRTSDLVAVVSFTCAVTNAANGIFTVSLTSTQTSQLPTLYGPTAEKESLELVYDIEASNGSTVYRLLEGIAKVSPEVTK